MKELNESIYGGTDVVASVAGVPLIEGEYYKINGTNKVLYWDGTRWMKPIKDQQRRFGSWLAHLDKQPTNAKSVELVDIYKLT